MRNRRSRRPLRRSRTDRWRRGALACGNPGNLPGTAARSYLLVDQSHLVILPGRASNTSARTMRCRSERNDALSVAGRVKGPRATYQIHVVLSFCPMISGLILPTHRTAALTFAPGNPLAFARAVRDNDRTQSQDSRRASSDCSEETGCFPAVAQSSPRIAQPDALAYNQWNGLQIAVPGGRPAVYKKVY